MTSENLVLTLYWRGLNNLGRDPIFKSRDHKTNKCLERNMCEHPKHYLTKVSKNVMDTVVCDTSAVDNGLFFNPGTTCRFGCDKGTF